MTKTSKTEIVPNQPLRLIVGLGNPGDQYTQTRHNAGFWFVDQIARRYQIDYKVDKKFHGVVGQFHHQGQDIRLLKPATFMNNSGRAVAAICQFYKIKPAEILIAHDELDFPAGKIRLKFSGGHGGHNGLRDMAAIKSRDYWRLRIGIGRPAHKDQVLDFVLKQPNQADAQAITQALEAAEQQFERMLQGQFEEAMLALHS